MKWLFLFSFQFYILTHLKASNVRSYPQLFEKIQILYAYVYCVLCPDRSILKAPQCIWNTSIDNSPSQNTPSQIRHDGREIWKFIPPPQILYFPEAIAHSGVFCKWALSSINNYFYFKSKFRIMYLKNLQKAFRSLINCYIKYYNNNLLKVFENHYYISILYRGIIQIIQTLNIHILYKSD